MFKQAILDFTVNNFLLKINDLSQLQKGVKHPFQFGYGNGKLQVITPGLLIYAVLPNVAQFHLEGEGEWVNH